MSAPASGQHKLVISVGCPEISLFSTVCRGRSGQKLIKVYINYFVSRKFLIFCFHAVIIVHVREKDLIKKNKDVWCASGSIWLGVGVHSTAGGFSYLGLERLHLLLQQPQPPLHAVQPPPRCLICQNTRRLQLKPVDFAHPTFP